MMVAKNMNIPYAKVGRRVFNSLRDAQSFCKKNGYEPRDSIEYRDDPELKKAVQGIAQYQKAILRECLDLLKDQAETIIHEIHRYNADLEKCHPLDENCLTARRDEAIAKHTGVMEAREIIAGLKNDLEKLTGWRE